MLQFVKLARPSRESIERSADDDPGKALCEPFGRLDVHMLLRFQYVEQACIQKRTGQLRMQTLRLVSDVVGNKQSDPVEKQQ